LNELLGRVLDTTNTLLKQEVPALLQQSWRVFSPPIRSFRAGLSKYLNSGHTLHDVPGFAARFAEEPKGKLLETTFRASKHAKGELDMGVSARLS
jgi:hypothetical protein